MGLIVMDFHKLSRVCVCVWFVRRSSIKNGEIGKNLKTSKKRRNLKFGIKEP